MFLFLLLLSGCGVELTSKVNLDENFSGTRTMSCTFSSRDFQRYFDGTQKDLDQTIEDSCPSQLTYKRTSDGGNYIYTFSLSFSSLDDYQEKVEKILNFAPKVTWQYGDSPFVSGLIYKENFSSTDLMTWLYTALYEKGYVDQDSAEQFMDLKETTITVMGKTYTTDNKISIDEMNYTELSSISMETETQDDGSLKRKISFYIPQKVLDQNTGKIEAYFKDSDPSWSSWKNGRILNITVLADSLTDLSAKTREVLHSDSSYGTCSVSSAKDNPFGFRMNYRESLDFSQFIQKKGTVPVTYTFDGKEVLDDAVKSKSLEFTGEYAQPISSYDIITVWKNGSDIRRKFSFSFESGCSSQQLSCMKKAFSGSTISDVELSETDGSIVLTFQQQGSVEDCSSDLNAIFPKASLSADTTNSPFRGSVTSFQDTFEFTSGNKDVKGTYTFASVNSSESASVQMEPQDKVIDTKTQALSNREVSRLLKSDETVHDFSQFTLSGDSLDLSYEGNTTASHWYSIAGIVVPVAFFLCLALFILIRRQWIAAQAIRLKKWIEPQAIRLKEWIEQKISNFKK